MHHYNKSENYRYHVIRIGKFDFCNGCFANRIFLATILPFYLWLMASSPSPYFLALIMSYVFFQISLTASIAFTGREMLLLFSGIFTTIYLLVAHGVILYGQMLFEISTNILLISIFLSILPQFSMYLWKINQKKEFKYPIAKLGIRLSFIHAYFFTVLLVRNNLILGLSIIALTSVSFILIREMSSQNLKKLGRNHTNKNQNVFRVLSHNLSKSRINLGFLSPGNLIEDTSASQEDFCEVCCGCCACIICCGTCGMCDAMDDYPVDGGFQ